MTTARIHCLTRILFTTLVLVSILLLLSLPPTIATKAQINSGSTVTAQITVTPTSKTDSSFLERAIQQAVEQHRLDTNNDYYYNILEITANDDWGIGKAEKIRKDTNEVIPSDFYKILGHRDSNGTWQVVLPDKTDSYLDLLNVVPVSILNDETKTNIRDEYALIAPALFSDHYLPWSEGGSAVVIKNYSTHSSGDGPALDFGFTGFIRTSKAGTLIFAYDSHNWSKCTGQLLDWCRDKYPEAWYYDNAVVIKHAEGEYSAYLHMQTGSIPEGIISNCQNGNGGICDPVDIPAGTIIGTVGSIGLSTDPHLHFATGTKPYGNCTYADFDDEDNDGDYEESNICSGGIEGGYLVPTDFIEKPYNATNCGTGAGQDPKLCMLYYPPNTDLLSENIEGEVGNLGGTIWDSKRQPAVGAKVHAVSGGTTATTNKNGNFAIYNIPAGNTFIQAGHPLYGSGEKSWTVAARQEQQIGYIQLGQWCMPGKAAGEFMSSALCVAEPALGIQWNTFLGGNEGDTGSRMAIDHDGNIYLVGQSNTSWGDPIRPFVGTGGPYYYDVFVAKVNANGVLQWNTFLGGTDKDLPGQITLDESGNIYVSGLSNNGWGNPINPFKGSINAADSFLAKINGDGALQWSTFLDVYKAGDIALDTSGNIYILENSYNVFSNTFMSMYVSKLGNNGNFIWRSSLANTSSAGNGIAVANDGNIFVSGHSWNDWGTPITPFAGDIDAFIARLDGNGVLQWHTFLGGPGEDYDYDLKLNGSDIYLAGRTGNLAANISKISGDGVLQWNTLLGNSGDWANGIAIDNNAHIYVTGSSQESWGKPINAFAGLTDTFIAYLDNNGVIQWNTFIGGAGTDDGRDIKLDDHQNVYVSGYTSHYSWGAPINQLKGISDAFVTKLSTVPVVNSISRINPSPTATALVSFTVNFSAPVTGVNTSAPFNDFALYTTGVTGAAITNVSGSGTTYTITVNTGTGGGMVRLEVIDDDSIRDAANIPLGGNGSGNGNFTSGEGYTITRNIAVTIAGNSMDSYYVPAQSSMRQSYLSLNQGPVKIENTEGFDVVASQRVLYGSSYSEMMGLPVEQLSKEYLFPYYNNVAMDSQLRVSNLGGTNTTITVYLGTTQIDQYSLAAGGATRKNYTGRNSGPLRVTSSASDILATTRVVYNKNSYSEILGLPVEQMAKEYLFPYYNNVAMDSQLRVSNVGGAKTTITVYLGTAQIDSYPLAAGGATRKSYTGRNSGPLRVTSSASNILTTIRVLYAGNSYSELMGFPAGQLSQSYWYPVYDNAAVDSQLRVSNVGSATTHITVYAGGTQIDSYDLAKGAATRKNYPKNTGPLQVVSSTQPILTTIRLLYGGGYYEMTGLPESQLSTQYFFPWYNNTAMSSELRIAIP
jgi:hypothetical protein